MHPRSRHWHMIEFIITRCRDKTGIHSTRAMRGVNCWTDYQMLKSKVAFRMQQKHNKQGTSKPTKLNTAKLSTIIHRESFEQEMDNALARWEEKDNSTTDEQLDSSAAGCVQHSQDISWQARQKPPELVRPQRPEATNTYEQMRPSPPKSVAKKERQIRHCSI